MQVLIGSRALNEYVTLDRVMHDWDFIMSPRVLENFNKLYKEYLVKQTAYSFVYDIKDEIVEIRNPENLDPSDWNLLEHCGHDSVLTPFGWSFLPSLQFLYDIKKSTSICIPEYKHQYDLNLLESKFGALEETEFFKTRLAETQKRIGESKRIKHDFFHKYHIPEYVLHDRLHEMIADLLNINIPTYQRIIDADVSVADELFNKLTHEQKISLMVEETLVLNLERWFIPQMIENGINARLIPMFYNNNEAMPTYLILKHVNLTGLKGEKPYIVDFGKQNFFEIEKAWQEAKLQIKSAGGFPNWFFDELFSLREQYKKGEVDGYAQK